MEAKDWIRRVKIIDRIESIAKFSYGLDIDEVIKLMNGYAEYKLENNSSDAQLNEAFKNGYKAAIENLNACYKDIF